MSNHLIYCENCNKELSEESERNKRLHEKCKPNQEELVKLMKFANDVRPLLGYGPEEEIGISDLREGEYGPHFKTENGIVTEFAYRYSQAKAIPVSFYEFTGLKNLILKDAMPADQLKSLSKLTELEYIWFSEMRFTEIPNVLTQLKELRELAMDNNRFIKIGDSIGQLPQLEHLELYQNELDVTTLPDSIGQLQQLKYLDLSYNSLTAVPKSIGQLKQLEYLDLSYNLLTNLPESIGQLKNLKELHIYENELTTLPESIGQLKNLKVLTIAHNMLSTIPESIENRNDLKIFKD